LQGGEIKTAHIPSYKDKEGYGGRQSFREKKAKKKMRLAPEDASMKDYSTIDGRGKGNSRHPEREKRGIRKITTADGKKGGGKEQDGAI